LYFVCCLIVVPLPPGENPFAVNNNNNNKNNILTSLYLYGVEEENQENLRLEMLCDYMLGLDISPITDKSS
jgi:hypothetical protein